MERQDVKIVPKKSIPDDCPLQKATVTIKLDNDNLTQWFKDAISKAQNNR